MKRTSILLSIGFVVLNILFTSIVGWGADIYVSLSGSDNNPGTKEKPMATVAMALRKGREMRRLQVLEVKEGIRIIIDRGVYSFSEPLFVRPEDSGTESSPTIIQAAEWAA